jgi:NAD-dependent deacetylase
MVPCPTCGAPTRPGSVWYGESLPPGVLDQVRRFDPDGCLLIGSSCLVQPVSSIPAELATLHPVVEVNVEETHFSPLMTCSLRGTAKDLLPGLVDLLTSHTVRDQQGRSG